MSGAAGLRVQGKLLEAMRCPVTVCRQPWHRPPQTGHSWCLFRQTKQKHQDSPKATCAHCCESVCRSGLLSARSSSLARELDRVERKSLLFGEPVKMSPQKPVTFPTAHPGPEDKVSAIHTQPTFKRQLILFVVPNGFTMCKLFWRVAGPAVCCQSQSRDKPK